MTHLRIVVPKDLAERTLDLLCAAPAVASVIHLEDAAHKPKGDVILCDVAREDASVILSTLKELGIHKRGTIALEEVDGSVSDAADRAERAATGLPSDAVVWEEVEARTSENTELSASFVAFMTIATIIASIGILTDSPVLIIGAMVVGPEFGPLAALAVALVEKRRDFAWKSFIALAVGFPVAMTLTLLATLFFNWVDIAPDTLAISRPLTDFISHPNWLSVAVAYLAGTAGILSLTNAKSGALVGVLISVTTIPAAANVAVAVAYSDWDEWVGAMGQLSLNLALLTLAGIVTLFVQRRVYISRRRDHLTAQYRQAGGLPLGQSRSGSVILPGYTRDEG